MPPVYLALTHNQLAEWAFPQQYEPVWTNNEYDSIFAVCTEIMRSGRADLWQQARWAARHNAEVDFVHYHDDPQQHRACPQHSYRHNRSGAVLSHFWTQGLLQYYCLTGDQDVLEVARRFPAMPVVNSHIDANFCPQLAELPNIWLDISGGAGGLWIGSLEAAVQAMGPDRLLYGTDFTGYEPRAFQARLQMCVPDPVEQEKVRWKNVVRLLESVGSRPIVK
jgi:hypothetical protein